MNWHTRIRTLLSFRSTSVIASLSERDIVLKERDGFDLDRGLGSFVYQAVKGCQPEVEGRERKKEEGERRIRNYAMRRDVSL